MIILLLRAPTCRRAVIKGTRGLYPTPESCVSVRNALSRHIHAAFTIPIPCFRRRLFYFPYLSLPPGAPAHRPTFFLWKCHYGSNCAPLRSLEQPIWGYRGHKLRQGARASQFEAPSPLILAPLHMPCNGGWPLALAAARGGRFERAITRAGLSGVPTS